ncbi:sigma-70 family RNA polymerase sigma factor [Prolixibacteraceae bacterium JC049]|nr:sigma-70 family RNA polymerase sigma factor [Prolixibacteraceae bacterium JC049]
MKSTQFEQEILRMQNKLYRFAFSLLKSEAEAQDAVQEVVLKLWKQRKKLDFNKPMDTLAMTITHNYCMDIIRKRANHFNWQKSNTAFRSCSSNVEQVDLLNQVKEFIGSLPPQ